MDSDPKPPAYDPARALTLGALLGVAMITLFVCAVIGWQTYLGVPVGPEYSAALTFVLGWVTSKAGDIFANRFGSTQESSNKNQTITQLARTQAVTQDALLDESVVVTTGGKKLATAAMPDAPAGPPASGAPLQAENVVVNTLNTKVDQVDPKP